MGRCLRILLAFLSMCAAMYAAESSVSADRRWSVRPGDTLIAIARRFDVEQGDLKRWNEIHGDQIRVGQELVVAPDGSATDNSAVTAATKAGQPDPSKATPPAPVPPGSRYTVAAGDTLSGIAERMDVSIERLLEWNPAVDPDRIRAGQTLRMGAEGREVRHQLRTGDTLTAVARRYRVTVADLLRWNAGVSANRVRAGATLTVFTELPDSRSKSIGTPSRGQLQFAERLRPHRGYRIRDAARAWGTQEVVTQLRKAFDHVVRGFPKAPKVEVHDLSYRAGGPIAHHRSHQSGRDVDIAYFHNACRRRTCGFNRIGARQLDVKRQWALLSYWLKRNQLEAVFIDYPLQAALYRHAKARGASPADLKHWFQYPRGRRFQLGVIRHFPKHADHMHVRFACHKSDPECRTFRPLLMHARHASR